MCILAELCTLELLNIEFEYSEFWGDVDIEGANQQDDRDVSLWWEEVSQYYCLNITQNWNDL